MSRALHKESPIMDQIERSLPTIGVIADRCGKKVHQVAYAIRSLGLKPSARAGRLRVFSEEEVATIFIELARTGAIRSGRSAPTSE